MATIQQILDSLVSIASGQMPRNGLNKTAHSHGEVAENAVLWRLSEPLFRNLLGIEMTASKFIVLLRWLDSRRPVFGYTTVEMPPDQSEEGKLWWNNHDPRIPRHTPSSAAEDELFKNGYSGEAPMTANCLRRVYETKEIEFKLTSGVNVPKFRLAALQQLFGPVFFERKRCFPMVLVDSLVAKVWKNLRFERLICTLLRDSDEKIVLGALSLLDCSTRVFRFDLLRSPTDRSTPLSSYSYTCPERDFAIQLCSQSVVSEVKRVLDKTIRALKVLGESGASSASRSQQPLVAILCVGISWLVNCLHGGDNATQFWGVAGINQLIIAHCKANSLPFVKIKDLNMMNQFFIKLSE
ncbi:Bifunctional aspartate aminotransferase [Phytophthora nicotianae]|uniref:Bifunctional aspartate aminotransferase n=1 Tax=Phytophthora nicotianae TaxID=4792 RepID=A0A0W8D9J9_PHYNI|nr:Bifunctional aspartate aminotransferase [Phytophthora nicotianae]